MFCSNFEWMQLKYFAWLFVQHGQKFCTFLFDEQFVLAKEILGGKAKCCGKVRNGMTFCRLVSPRSHGNGTRTLLETVEVNRTISFSLLFFIPNFFSFSSLSMAIHFQAVSNCSKNDARKFYFIQRRKKKKPTRKEPKLFPTKLFSVSQCKIN